MGWEGLPEAVTTAAVVAVLLLSVARGTSNKNKREREVKGKVALFMKD